MSPIHLALVVALYIGTYQLYRALYSGLYIGALYIGALYRAQYIYIHIYVGLLSRGSLLMGPLQKAHRDPRELQVFQPLGLRANLVQQYIYDLYDVEEAAQKSAGVGGVVAIAVAVGPMFGRLAIGAFYAKGLRPLPLTFL